MDHCPPGGVAFSNSGNSLSPSFRSVYQRRMSVVKLDLLLSRLLTPSRPPARVLHHQLTLCRLQTIHRSNLRERGTFGLLRSLPCTLCLPPRFGFSDHGTLVFLYIESIKHTRSRSSLGPLNCVVLNSAVPSVVAANVGQQLPVTQQYSRGGTAIVIPSLTLTNSSDDQPRRSISWEGAPYLRLLNCPK